MKKRVQTLALTALTALALTSCGSRSGSQAEAFVVPEGYTTHEFAHFTVSLPEEFTTTGEEDYGGTTTVRFSSEALLRLDDGEEHASRAYVDCGYMEGGATPSQIQETATNLKLGQEGLGEICDEPIIDGNIILLRHACNNDDGYNHANGFDGSQVITWRWWIVSDDGKNVSGNINYPAEQAQYYDGVARNIAKSIKMK